MKSSAKNVNALETPSSSRKKGWILWISCWQNKRETCWLENQTNRSTIVKSVLCSVPTYTMSAFTLLIFFCDSIDSLSRRFWLGKINSEGRFFAPINWDNLTQPKQYGGLGFGRARDFNKAMLTKMAWLMIIESNSLVATMLTNKYENFINLIERRNDSCSLFWRNLQSCRDTSTQRYCKLIRNGSNTKVWTEVRIPNNDNFRPSPVNNSVVRDPSTLVKDLMIGNSWNLSPLTTLFHSNAVSNVLKIFPSGNEQEDEYCWLKNKYGINFIKSVYLMDQDRRFNKEK